VIGVDRGAGALELRASGADLVVDDLDELVADLPAFLPADPT
jgi:phosphoglycolate phosphatase-like HAD superfamily hydrolase